MSTDVLIAIASGGLEEPTFGEILSNILSAISSILQMALNQVKNLSYLFTPFEITYGPFNSLSEWNTFIRSNPGISDFVERSTNFDTGSAVYYGTIPGHPLLFIFLCFCIIGLGITIFRRLANVN